MIKLYVKLEDLKPSEPNETIGGPNWDSKRQNWYESMMKEGIKEPIAIDSTGKIIDGNLRYFFAKENGIEFLWVNQEYLKVKDDNKPLITKLKSCREKFKELNKAYRSYRVRYPCDPPGKK